MRVFLTGATGFIGGHVARKLRERGDDVRVLVRSTEKGAELEALGCELGQGWLFGRPMPPEAFRAWHAECALRGETEKGAGKIRLARAS